MASLLYLPGVLARLLWPLALLGVTLAALGLRLLAAPSGESIRAAVAPAPAGSAYEATANRGLVLVGPGGERRTVASLPTRSPLALAAGDILVLGAADGVFTSEAGAGWARAALPGNHFLAVATRRERVAAASWAGGLWLSDDRGRTWRRSPLPEGDIEVTSISLGDTDLVGTLLGVLSSHDGGASWTQAVGVPGRITAVDRDGEALMAAAWAGKTYRSDSAAGWRTGAGRRPGIWAISARANAVATTDGLYLRGVRRLRGREVTGLAFSDRYLYAFQAGGGVSVFKV